MIHYNTVQATCNTTLVHNLGLAGKRPVRTKSPLHAILILREVPGFRSAVHFLFQFLAHLEISASLK